MKPMEIESKLTAHATAFGAADAPGSGSQDAGEKWATGQRKKLIRTRAEVKIAAWNVRTGHHVGEKEIIARELSRCKISITALSELRITGSGTVTIPPTTTDDTMTLFYSGGQKREAGVGFMVNSQAANSVITFQPISDRLAILTIKGTIKTHIISIYSPTEASSDLTKNDFYNQLQHALDSIPQTEMIILAGDFNAHIGVDRNGWEAVMGRFGHGDINDNGLRLLSFATSNNLTVGNSLFQHPRKHQLTWRNPSGMDSAVLDYVLINSRFRSSLKDVRAMRGLECGSDHCLVRAVVQLRLQRPKKKLHPSVRLDWGQLMETTLKRKFQITLSNRFAALAQSENVDVEEKQISDTIVDCAKHLCPPIRHKTQPWISNECLDLVDERKRVKLIDHERYRQLNREIRNRMKAEREAHWNRVAADLEEAASKHEYRTLYQPLSKLSRKAKSTNDNIRKTDGTFVQSSCERLQRWKEFFQELYNHEQPHGALEDPPRIDPPEATMFPDEPTIEEVQVAIRSLRNGKAPGADQVTAEAIKAGGNALLHRLHSLLQTIWRTEQIPSTWKKAIIIPIHKKGDNSECKNYRGISLLSIIGKVFMKVIKSRLQKHREQTTREEQAGFRPNRGCCDQIFTIRQLMEERTRCGQRTVIVFIDFKSAFDCIHRPALWKALETEHIPSKVIKLLQTSYNGSTSRVQIRNESSEEFSFWTGVRQGDVVSPLLFNVVIDTIMRKVFQGRCGVQYDKDNFATDLMFADDSAILANDNAEATDILRDIARIAQSYGLKINVDKTKVLTTNGSPSTVYLSGTQIKQIQNFKYLGSVVQERKVAATSEIHGRIGQAATAFASLKWCLWKRTNIHIKTKIRLFRSLIIPILLYGSET